MPMLPPAQMPPWMLQGGQMPGQPPGPPQGMPPGMMPGGPPQGGPPPPPPGPPVPPSPMPGDPGMVMNAPPPPPMPPMPGSGGPDAQMPISDRAGGGGGFGEISGMMAGMGGMPPSVASGSPNMPDLSSLPPELRAMLMGEAQNQGQLPQGPPQQLADALRRYGR